MFQLIFKGECVAGTDQAAARNSARQLFKANDAQLARMFSGQPVVIRNQLEHAQAEKYCALMYKHGMQAYVQAMAVAPDGASVSAAKPPPAPKPQVVAQTAQRRFQHPDANRAALPIAGERTDALLAGSALTLDPPGTTLAERAPIQPRRFEHLQGWSLAPAGTDIGHKDEPPPPMVPDTSHLALQPLPDTENER